ncbi:MAG TPA: 2'-5' RNA ligase family protein, partial [Actinomycetota bacterium]|nr:2'-5' RNA ligase family protein [Actinomycetota bacterium]
GMQMLAVAVAEALEAIGFPREERTFHPHITVARLRAPERVSIGVDVPAMRFSVDRVTLYESRLGRVPQYEALATFPFRRDGVRHA